MNTHNCPISLQFFPVADFPLSKMIISYLLHVFQNITSPHSFPADDFVSYSIEETNHHKEAPATKCTDLFTSTLLFFSILCGLESLNYDPSTLIKGNLARKIIWKVSLSWIWRDR